VAHAARPPARKKEERSSFLQNWKRPLTAAAGIAVVLLLLVVFRSALFGKGDRLSVYPARGQATFAGKPMSNATIFLHPVGVKDPRYPRPRAVVAEDGTFALGTYRKDDGAPAGEYRVTVQWFRKVADRDVPVNVLPARLAGPETSGLSVRIEKGKNDLPPIQLR
jgi:hypothetical protein